MKTTLSRGYHVVPCVRGGEDIVYSDGENIRLVCNTKPIIKNRDFSLIEEDEREIWDEEANVILRVTFFHCGIIQRVEIP